MAFKKKVPIRLTSRDFQSIRDDLIEYAKRYYPESFKDFSESSFGSLMIDSVAYIGDILSYGLDYSTNESFLDSAIEYNNIIRHGRVLGYKFKGNPSSYGVVSLYVIIPAKVSGTGPDTRYYPILLKGSEFSSTSGVSFMLLENVDFSHSQNEILVAAVSNTTGLPISYAVKASGKVISGEYYEEQISIGNFEKFLRVNLNGSNIAEVLSVVDAEGHEYYEVETLSQNVIYRSVTNKSWDREYAPSVLKPIIVTRRYVVEQEDGVVSLQFGYGSAEEIKSNNVLEPTNVALKLIGKDYISDDSFDPSKLLETDKFGVAPSNTTLRVITRNNTSENVNAAAGTVVEVKSPMFEFDEASTLDPEKMNSIVASLECSNEDPIIGDISLPDMAEIRVRIKDSFSAQNRAVTGLDYKSAIYNMPVKFGCIKRCAIYQDEDSFKRNLNVYVIAENSAGNLTTATSTLKENLKTWILSKKMINDTVDILDAYVINLGIEFKILARDDVNKYSALTRAVEELVAFYDKKFDIGEPFLITDVYKVLRNVDEVLDVVNVKVKCLNGGAYSDAMINVDNMMSPDGRMVRCYKNCVYEIKNPRTDIVGTVK